MKFYIIDDDKNVLNILKIIIRERNLGEICGTAQCGKDALEDFVQIKPDIVITDLLMPEMDGIEVLHILKKLAKNFDVPPIVALTANAVTGMREMYLNEGFDEYVAKPINVSELNKVINKFFRRDNNE